MLPCTFLKAVTFWRPPWADSALCIKTSQFSVSSLQIVGEGAHRLSSFLSKFHPSTTCSLTFLLDAFLHSLRLSQVDTSWWQLWHPDFPNSIQFSQHKEIKNAQKFFLWIRLRTNFLFEGIKFFKISWKPLNCLFIFFRERKTHILHNFGLSKNSDQCRPFS